MKNECKEKKGKGVVWAECAFHFQAIFVCRAREWVSMTGDDVGDQKDCCCC